MVVISEKSYQVFGMRIERVVLKNLNQPLHRRIFDHNLAQSALQREVEYCGQSGIEAVELFSSALKKRCDGGIGVGDFANTV